jgi:hypothetical protein
MRMLRVITTVGGVCVFLSSALSTGCGGSDTGAAPGEGAGGSAASSGGSGPALDGAVSNFPAAPLSTFQTADKRWNIELRTLPQPPHLGPGEAELRVADAATGQPVEGLRIAVVPYAPEMKHGSPVTPKVRETGGGVYHVTNLSPSMPGEWQLKLTLKASLPDGGVGETVTAVSPNFEVVEG